MTGRKPLFIVKPGTIKREDIRRAERQSLICVVECSDPDSARFLEPPADADLDVQARAALSLMRMITQSGGPFQRGELLKWFVDRILDTNAKPATVPHVPSGPQPKGSK